ERAGIGVGRRVEIDVLRLGAGGDAQAGNGGALARPKVDQVGIEIRDVEGDGVAVDHAAREKSGQVEDGARAVDQRRNGRTRLVQRSVVVGEPELTPAKLRF